MNRQQIKVLLRNRDTGGNLDHNLLMQSQREREGHKDETPEAFAELRLIRRLQGWPEYLIDKAVKTVEAANGGHPQ